MRREDFVEHGRTLLRAQREAVDEVALILRVTGEVDLHTRAQFEQLLQTGMRDCAAQRNRLIVDLTGLTDCDAGGLRCLHTVEQNALARRVWLVLVLPAEHILNRTARSVVRLSSLTNTDVATALARMSESPDG
jgi:anti-anti-sigma factor